MKTIFKIVGLIIISIIIIAVSLVGSIYMGWLPIPKFVTNIVAHKKGLSDKEAVKMNQIANVYQILKQSNGDDLKLLEKMLIEGEQPKDGVVISTIYKNISNETLEKIGKQLEIDSTDLKIAKRILRDTVMTSGQIDTLQIIQNKYGLSDTLLLKLFSK